MDASRVQFYYNNRYNALVFSGSERQFGTKITINGYDFLKNNFTKIGRDERWFSRQELVKHLLMLTDKKDAPVELLFCGCSDGSEPIDVTMELLKNLKEQHKKFPENLKISAFDKDEVIADYASRGRLNLTNNEMDYINRHYSDYISDFVSKPQSVMIIPNDTNLSKYVNSYQFSPEITEKIKFYNSDLIKELNALDPNTHKIVFCRNLAIYLPLDEQKQAAELLNQKLRPDSLLICGVRDTDFCSPQDAMGIYKHLKYKDSDATPRISMLCNKDKPYWTVPNPFISRLEKYPFKHNSTIGCAYQKQAPQSQQVYYKHYLNI